HGERALSGPSRCWRRAMVALTAASVLCPLFAGVAWPVDLAANLSAQAALGAVAAAVYELWRGRLANAAVLTAVCVLLAIWLAGGRAPRDQDAPSGDQLRVLVFNAGPANTDVDGAVELIRRAGADVVCLVEPAPDLVRRLRRA